MHSRNINHLKLSSLTKSNSSIKLISYNWDNQYYGSNQNSCIDEQQQLILHDKKGKQLYNTTSPQKTKNQYSQQQILPSLQQINIPKEKLTTLLNVSQTERITTNYQIPFCKTKRLLKKNSIPKTIKSQCLLDIQQNSSQIFIFKASIQDISQYKMISIPRCDLINKYTQDIYESRQQKLHKIQMAMNVQKSYTQLSLGNYEVIQFFEEIPQNCNILLLSNIGITEFWTIILNYHNLQYTKEKFGKLLTILHKLNNLHDIQKFLLDKDTFYTYMETLNIENDDQYLLMKRNQDIMKEYYKSIHIYEHERKKILKNQQLNQIEMHFNQQVDQTNDENDQIKPQEYQTILEKEGYSSPYKRKSRYLHMVNFQQQCNEIIKSQTFKQKHENQFTNIQDCIARELPHMTNYNLPKLIEETGFDRQEIYQIYSRYKALLSYECAQIPGITKQMIPSGISKNVFIAGLEELSMAPPGVVDQIFQFYQKQNKLSFDGFLKAINLIKAKRNENKIQLILKLIDENENEKLSYDEIKNRCVFMMEETLKGATGELSVENMVEYVTKSIFDAVEMKYDEEIPIDKIKKLIESRTNEAKILIMMCCGDVDFLQK